MSAPTSQPAHLARFTLQETISLLADLLGIVVSLITLGFLLKGRAHRFRSRVGRALAGIIALGYLGWFAIAVMAWGVVIVAAVEQPEFFTVPRLSTHIVATLAYFFVVVLGPALPVGLVIKHLDPEHWPGRPTRKRSFRLEKWRSQEEKKPAAATAEIPHANPGFAVTRIPKCQSS